MPVPRIVVIGSSNTDLVLAGPRLPRPGETIMSGPLLQLAGGKGANQAVAAARAGARVTFIGAHGNDAFGRSAKAALRAEGIDVRHFSQRTDAGSGVALILVGGETRENLIAVARSANDTVSEADVLRAERAIATADIVLAQLEVPLAAVTTAAELAKKHGRLFVLNPAPARKLASRTLRLVHTLTPNETEATMLTGEKDPVEAAKCLLARGCRRVVVTLGSRGAVLVEGRKIQTFPAPKVRAVDTVGAGDCFTAWLAVGLAAGKSADEAVERAVRAAAICVTRVGAQNGLPSASEV